MAQLEYVKSLGASYIKDYHRSATYIKEFTVCLLRAQSIPLSSNPKMMELHHQIIRFVVQIHLLAAKH